nr:hypothetical protein [Tanacetum cinerariifolium]
MIFYGCFIEFTMLGIKCTRHSHCQVKCSHWQYKFPLSVKVVATARRLEMPLLEVCTAMEEKKKKLPVKDRWNATITAASATITVVVITTAPSATRKRKGVVIRHLEETATPSIIIHSEPISKDKGKGIMVEEPKPLKKQAQIEQDEAYARELKAKINKNIN